MFLAAVFAIMILQNIKVDLRYLVEIKLLAFPQEIRLLKKLNHNQSFIMVQRDISISYKEF